MHEAEPLFGDWTFHKIMSASAAICAVLTLVFSLGNVIRHLVNYTRPCEQRHIVRILLTPFVFATFYFFSLWFYSASAYLEPVAELYEVFALVACFLLFLAYVCTDETRYDEYFANLERQNRKQIKKHSHGSLRWFYCAWIMVFQVLAVRFACTIASWVIHAVMCPLDPNLQYASIVIEVVESFSTAMCLITIIRFYRRLRPELKERHALSKLITFKVIVGIQIIQGPVISGLVTGGVLSASKHISFEDWSIGFPAFLTCIEMLIFSLIFIIPFSAKEYTYPRQDPEAQGQKPPAKMGFFSALLHSFDISDVIMGALFHNKLVKVFKKQTTEKDNKERQQDGALLRPAYQELDHEGKPLSAESSRRSSMERSPERQWI